MVRVCPGVMRFGFAIPLAFAMSQIPTPNFLAMAPSVSPAWTTTVVVALLVSVVPLVEAFGAALLGRVATGSRATSSKWTSLVLVRSDRYLALRARAPFLLTSACNLLVGISSPGGRGRRYDIEKYRNDQSHHFDREQHACVARSFVCLLKNAPAVSWKLKERNPPRGDGPSRKKEGNRDISLDAHNKNENS